MTATHSIFLVGLLVSGAGLGAAVLHGHAELVAARRVDAEARDAAVHTSIKVASKAWDVVAGRATYTLDNEGGTTLDVRLLEFVLDGVWRTDTVESGWTVDGAATDWWPPETTLTIALAPLAVEPTDTVVATEYGAPAYWRG